MPISGKPLGLPALSMEQQRKTLIADTAIALLGSVGARGLTHRAVDAEAGLPTGSTSFYCRSRLDLLRIALQRHAALDLADLMQDAEQAQHPDWRVEDLLDLLTHRVDDWLSPAKRGRLVARFELFLLASREPELAAILDTHRQHFLQAALAALQRAGVARAEALAPLLVMAIDGLLLDRVRTHEQTAPTGQLRELLQRIIQG
jgi:DNA-binding transcriptional regulator YbjK